MALTDEEKQAVRYYMGYPALTTSFGVSLGLVDKTNLNFILEGNMNRIIEDGEKWVRRSIQELQCIEDKRSSIRSNIEVRRVTGSLEFDMELGYQLLDDDEIYWVSRLADTLGAPSNPFGNRLMLSGANGGPGPATVSEPC